MLALEDLIDLGEILRVNDFRIATHQYFSAQQLLLRLAADGALPKSHLALESFLGPIFCTSALEQRKFSGLYRDWIRDRFPQNDERAPAEKASEHASRRSLSERWTGVLLVLLIAAAAVLGWAAWQHLRTRTIEGRVLSDGQPAVGAQVVLKQKVATTNRDGKFAFSFTAADLPASLSASLGARTDSAPLAADLAASRSYLYFGAPLSVKVESLTLNLQPPTRQPLEAKQAPVAQIKNITTTQARLIQRFDAREKLPAPTMWERVSARNVALVALPLLLIAGWQARRLVARPRLQRLVSRTPKELREVYLPGGVRAILPGFPLRRLAQELRRRRVVESNELQPEATVAATLRRGGVFTPVRGSRAEPEYFALIDRESLSDHHALLAAEIVADLARSDVLIERYDFDHDATLCRRREIGAVVRAASAATRRSQTTAIELAELRERHPNHRVIVFADGSGCFDGFTGQPAAWLTTLLEWAAPMLLTPLPLARWGRREWALQSLGVRIIPLDAHGIMALIAMIGGVPHEARGGTLGTPMASHERTPARWLERAPPAPQIIDLLCRDLRTDLDLGIEKRFAGRGFAWIAACAAYPEIHWGITLRLGAGLIPQRQILEKLLPRIARLVWFRQAYMPDWLREALLDRMDDADGDRARETLRTLLESVVARSGEDIPLRVALGKPLANLHWWRRCLQALMYRLRRRRLRDLVSSAGEDSPLRDYVFLRFISGQPTGKLDITAPGALLRALSSRPALLLTSGIAVTFVALAAAAALAWLFPPLDTRPYVVTSSPVEFSDEGLRAAYTAQGVLLAPDGSRSTVRQSMTALNRQADGWHAEQTALDRDTWIRIAPGARYAITAKQDGAVGVWKVEPLVTSQAGPATAPSSASAMSTIAAPTRTSVVASRYRGHVWKRVGGVCGVEVVGESAPRRFNTNARELPLAAAFSGTRVAFALPSGIVEVWDVQQEQQVLLKTIKASGISRDRQM
ncbi:MAG: carboxypeptidase-like regulatory domain-containing protein, partial [Betaproteobacteria bacterium]